MEPGRSDGGQVAAASGACSFQMKELQSLLQQELGPAAAAHIQWSLSPLEYLARRRGQAQQKLVVNNVPVRSLLVHIPFLLDYCKQLIVESTPLQAQSAASKAANFASQLLAVLRVAGVQDRLGGAQQVQPAIELLEAALPVFKKLSGGQQSSTVPPVPQHTAIGNGQRVSQPPAHAGVQFPPPSISRTACGQAAAAAPAAAAAAAAAAPKPAVKRQTKSRSKGLDLSALLAAISPFAQQATNSPFPRDFPALLTEWARLVYGELADPSSIQVAPLLLYHWRTLLQYLRLCLLGAAAPGGAPPTLMPVSTAISHVQGLLHLLQHDSLQALFKAQQYQRVVDRFAAFKTILQTLQQPAPGQPPAVHALCSAEVAALLTEADPSRGGQAAAAAAATAEAAPAAAAAALAPVTSSQLASGLLSTGQQLSSAQQEVLGLVHTHLQAGALSAQQLVTVQDLLSVLKRQVADEDGSNRFETTLLPEGRR